MSDHEFDVLDELYFVLSFEQLREACLLDLQELVPTLLALYEKGWIRVLEGVDEDAAAPVNLGDRYHEYFYLASKNGLLAHNGNE
ncbi:MAG: hypothetical protein AAGA85_04160 [Bacteroidota bacterium]